MKALITALAITALALALPVVRAETAPDDLYYRIMLGEIAEKRGRLDVALAQYQAAALASADPRVAERAFALALLAGKPGEGLVAARRWRELAPDSRDARQALALALVDHGELETALPELEALRTAFAEQDRQQGFAAIAALLGQAGDKAAAYRALGALRARHPEVVQAYYYEAGAALAAGERTVAVALLEQATRTDPRWAPAHLMRARLLTEAGALERALEGLAQALETMPRDVQLRMAYARVLAGAGRLAEAGRQFDRLARDNPKDAEARLALGELALEAKQYDRAVAYLLEAVLAGGRDDEAYFELGQVEEARGDLAKAADWYARVRGGERELVAQIRLGGLKLRVGDAVGMREVFDQLRRSHPEQAVTIALGEAEAWRRADRWQDAFDALSRALAEQSEQADLLYARALIAERLDRLDVTEGDLRRLLAREPDHAQALNALGYTLADRAERRGEALELIQRALAQLPDDAAVLDSMGWVLYRLGRFAEAVEYLKRAQATSGEPEIAAHLVEVLWQAGQEAEARALFERALQAAPDDRFLLRVKEKYAW